jgi:hypothetical protein
VAEIPAEKFKRGWGKGKLAGRICGRILAEFCQRWQERGEIKLSQEDLWQLEDSMEIRQQAAEEIRQIYATVVSRT